jgi:zinc transport system substrate-binding protein
VGRKGFLAFHLILPILFSLLVQTLYAQQQLSMSNSSPPSLLGQVPVNETLNSLVTISNNSSKKLSVVSSIFPIYDFVNKIGGDKISSSLIIPAGIEPHDFDPTIRQIQTINSADVMIYNGLGIENWLTKIEPAHKIYTSNGINASYFDNSNANLLLAQLDELDKNIVTQLESCKKKDFISFHNSFSYFANRYGLTQHSISESGPEAEVTPTRLAEIIAVAKNLGLNVIFSEELMDPRYAQVIAQEIPNGKVLVLSPIEGLTKDQQSAGTGYIDKMQENIGSLSLGLECSQ